MDYVGFVGDVGFFGVFIFEYFFGGFVYVFFLVVFGVMFDFVWLDGDGRGDVELVVCGVEEGFDFYVVVVGEVVLLKLY